jgi:glycosyltransferase involved in cell wall biosynthesis
MSKISLAVVMITLNEGHNLKRVLPNLSNWANEIIILDSFSSDDTIDVALKNKVSLYQSKFQSFGSQWNKAISLVKNSNYILKIDPDEEISDELKIEIEKILSEDSFDGYYIPIQLAFMGKLLPMQLKLLRIWKNGKGRFSDVRANEHVIVEGNVGYLRGKIIHHDSPNLEHWLNKQNKYTTAEAAQRFKSENLSFKTSLFGDTMERRMWFKKNFFKLPFRYFLFFIYIFIIQGAWRVGNVGYAWAKLRVFVLRLIEYKFIEMKLHNSEYHNLNFFPGTPDERAIQL